MTADDEIRDDSPEGGTALAAEYVLGLLSEAETRAFEARLIEEPRLETAVVLWTEYLAQMAADLPETAPPAALKRRIEAEAFGAGRDRRPFWRQLLPYGLGAAVAALLVWATLESGLIIRTAAQPLYVADIAVEDGAEVGGALAIHAGWFAEEGELLVIRESGTVPADAALELWVIAGEGPPVSLGLVPADEERTRYVLPQAVAALLEGGTLAVSREPPGGSPTGAPTGPVLGTAPIEVFTRS